VKNRIAWLVGSIAALLLAGPPAAQAADVAASRPCYVYDGAQRPLVIGAAGFAPNHTVDFRACSPRASRTTRAGCSTRSPSASSTAGTSRSASRFP